MEKVELEVYSEQSNHAVARMPGRQFPATLIQGDSLSILCEEARSISLHLKAIGCADEEILYMAQEHQDKLLGRLLHYQQVLVSHGLSLPYLKPANQSDLVVLIPEDDGNAL